MISIKKTLLLIAFCVILLIPLGCSKQKIKPNILLITIDTLRRDHLGCYGYSLPTSPFIDRLAAGGVMFRKVFAPLPLTDPSHASILTSLHPLTHQVTRNSTELNLNVQTIAEVLKANGYHTIGAVAVQHLSSKYNFSQGFDSFSDQWDPGIKDWQGAIKHFNGKWQRVAKSVHQSVIEQVQDYLGNHRGKPLFIWVHYYDPHYPYIGRKEIDLGKKKMWNEYDKEIRYTDGYIEKLHGFLAEKGLAEKMVTCITADHGEQFGEHGASSEHMDFYTETALVPLIFHGYNIPPNKAVDRYASTMDVSVSLLKLANLSFERSVHGVPLLDSEGNPASISSREQLIIGNPLNVRSMQLISAPFSFILNFDFFHKFWYISRQENVPENRFRAVRKEWIHFKKFEKKDYYEVRINFPYIARKGFHFEVLRFDVKRNRGFAVGHRLSENTWSKGKRFEDNKPGTVTAFFPVTPRDSILGYIGVDKGTEITNLRFTSLPEKEFLEFSGMVEKIKSQKIFKSLRTLRKSGKIDELYNLDKDIPMKKNLLKNQEADYTKNVVESKKKIYRFLEVYYNDMKKMLGALKHERTLSEEEKDMLKSLGYL